jgi:ketosteroid isomerase-like protein
MRNSVRGTLLLGYALVMTACGGGGALTSVDSAAIADTIRTMARSAYDLSKPDAVQRFMSLYPADGRVVSATAGRVTTDRASLQASIESFWSGVGQFMVRPAWIWDAMEVDVLSRDAAVMTASYHVPHYTDRATRHVIGGVWTTIWSRQPDGWRVTHEHLSDMPRALAERLEAAMPQADSLASDPHRDHQK